MDERLLRYIEMVSPTLDNHPDIVFIKGTNLNYRYLNQAYQDLTSSSPSEIIGKTSDDLFEKNRAKRHRESDLRVLEQKAPIFFEINEIRESKKFHHEIIKSPIFTKDGEIIGIHSIARNISNQIQIREELSQDLQVIENLISNLPYPIFIKDLKGIYISVNQAFLRGLSLKEDQVVGYSDADLFDAEKAEIYKKTDRKVIESGMIETFVYSGSIVKQKYMTTKFPLTNEDETIGLVGVINPYIDPESLTLDLFNEQRILSIAEFTGGISHTLNNILTVVVGLTSVMITEEPDDTKRNQLKKLYDAGKEAAALINKLQTFSNYDKNKEEQFDIIELVDNVIDLININQSNIDLQRNYEQNKFLITGDKVQLSIVFRNVIQNAIDSMDSGLLKIEINEQFVERKDFYYRSSNSVIPGNYLRVAMIDNGEGIDSYSISKIFDPYFTTRQTKYGLGLSAVHGIINAHHGLIDISSEIDKGTEFEIFLPLR